MNGLLKKNEGYKSINSSQTIEVDSKSTDKTSNLQSKK